jgi:rhodanese-related sulfurtransferase
VTKWVANGDGPAVNQDIRVLKSGFVESTNAETNSLLMKTTRTIAIILAGLLDVSFAACAADAKDETKSFKNVGVAEFEKLRADKKNVVLDVRTKKEFEEGHMPGAVNIDVNAADFQEKVAKLDKSKTYLVHCAAGRRSVKACEKLGTLSFPKLYNLEGGFGAWQKAGNKPEK